jgi:hypothetical protein
VLPPSVQGEKTHLNDRRNDGGVGITSRRIARYQQWAREFQAEHPELTGKLRFVDTISPTRAPWLSAWDGIHYSLSGLTLDPTDDRSWFGGVSVQLTQMWLNELCNRDCNPDWAARIRDL